VIGYIITFLRNLSEIIARGKPIILKISGFILTVITISFSFYCGRIIEIIYLANNDKNILINLLMLFGIASCLACKSLINSTKEIIFHIRNSNKDKNSLNKSRYLLSQIVSRDVDNLSTNEILRSTAETLTENSVDGIFAPLFWIIVGSFFLNSTPSLIGPLSLGFAYKSSSTLDSMIGYKIDSLKSLGKFAARTEDIFTWVPCRIVLITLPLIKFQLKRYFSIIKNSIKFGDKYNSPNSGISESIFAVVIGFQLGGENKYNNKVVLNPLINPSAPLVQINTIQLIADSILQLIYFWILIYSILFFSLIFITS
tara:strand:- start:4560 stop:5498 length:939 start_codon:yes stop_codon:yes gene_type:complete